MRSTQHLDSPNAADGLPERIRDEQELESVLTHPSPELVRFIATISSPLVVLGAAGKMGPTLCLLARRAAELAGHPLEVIAVSRFQQGSARHSLEEGGVRCLSVDLLDRSAANQLPDTANLVYLVGLKFGTALNPAVTWATNCLVPASVCERYRQARIVALSTGNVYPLSSADGSGSIESDPLTPLGEYPNAAVARERLFEYFSQKNGTPVALIRLFYAVELRYGVLVDIARKVLAGEPIDLTNSCFNCIWQGDANEMILRSLALCGTPPKAWNLCHPKKFRVRDAAAAFGRLLGREPKFTGQERENALLGDPSKICAELGPPNTPMDAVFRWIADWVSHGGIYLDKPTHFEVRDGNY